MQHERDGAVLTFEWDGRETSDETKLSEPNWLIISTWRCVVSHNTDVHLKAVGLTSYDEADWLELIKPLPFYLNTNKRRQSMAAQLRREIDGMLRVGLDITVRK